MTKYTSDSSNFGANGPFFQVIREGLEGLADGGAAYAALAGGAWAPFARGQRISRIAHRASACSEIRVRRRRKPPLFADCRSAERTAAFG